VKPTLLPVYEVFKIQKKLEDRLQIKKKGMFSESIGAYY
jgi:hypothetical protein